MYLRFLRGVLELLVDGAACDKLSPSALFRRFDDDDDDDDEDDT